MGVFSLEMGLSGSEHQPLILQLFKSGGDEIIQSGSGLCLKTSKSLEEIKKVMADKGVSGVAVKPLDPNQKDLPKDIRAFIDGK